MDHLEAAALLAGASRAENKTVSQPTNVHLVTMEAVAASEDGTVLVDPGGDVFTPDDSQYVEIETVGSISEGDDVTVLLTGEPGGPMDVLSLGPIGEGDRQNAAIADAAQAAQTAWEYADSAHDAADAAQQSADDAGKSARVANTAANDALAQLSVVEDVAGTLQWISDHGTFVPTTDTTVQEGTVYFVHEGGDYVPIAEPTGNPAAQGWYVLDVSESQTDYIMAHLAVTSAGLWVLPSGIGDAAGPQTAPGYKLLLASDGARLYDASGQQVMDYGESISMSSSRPQYIGGENAYILFHDTDDDGVPDHITIGGDVTIGGTPLPSLTDQLTYDHSFTDDGTNYRFEATLLRGGTDITADVNPNQFVWYLRNESGDVLWARGPTMTIPIAQAGYRASVVGGFEEVELVALADSGGNGIVDADGNQIMTYDLLLAG